MKVNIKKLLTRLATLATTCPNGHKSVMQKTDGSFYCMDCGATWK